jgi:hypothetical protein
MFCLIIWSVANGGFSLMVTSWSFCSYDKIGCLSPLLSQSEEGWAFWGHAVNWFHDGLEPYNVEILIQILDQSIAGCPSIRCFWSPDGGIPNGAIMWRCSGQGHHDDEATLFCGVPTGATNDLRVIIGGILIRGCSRCRGAWCSS